MVGVKKTDYDVKDRAVKILDKKLKKQKKVGKDNTKQSLLDC